MYRFKKQEGRGPVVIKLSTWWHTYSMDRKTQNTHSPFQPDPMATMFVIKKSCQSGLADLLCMLQLLLHFEEWCFLKLDLFFSRFFLNKEGVSMCVSDLLHFVKY